MSRMEITPGMMISTAEGIDKDLKEWETQVTAIYSLYNEMAAMWEGPAIEAFKKVCEEERQQFMKLTSMMQEYQQAIIKMANDYTVNENDAKNILSRR